MNADQLKLWRIKLKKSQPEMVRYLSVIQNVGLSTLRHWEYGLRSIPQWVDSFKKGKL